SPRLYSSAYHLILCTYIADTKPITLSLHDALPIYSNEELLGWTAHILLKQLTEIAAVQAAGIGHLLYGKVALIIVLNIVDCFLEDRKRTRLNSSHVSISYADFCLQKIIA